MNENDCHAKLKEIFDYLDWIERETIALRKTLTDACSCKNNNKLFLHTVVNHSFYFCKTFAFLNLEARIGQDEE